MVVAGHGYSKGVDMLCLKISNIDVCLTRPPDGHNRQRSVRRLAVSAPPWAVWDDPGLYGYLQGMIRTVEGLG